MSQVTVTKLQETGNESSALNAEMSALDDRIRERAFAIFQQREPGDGGPIDHWLEAERDLRVHLETDLAENDFEFRLSLNVPGFDAGDLSVNTLPGALIVRGVAETESTQKTLLSRFDLPTEIRGDRVTATLDHGVLQITAPKAVAVGKRTVGSERAALTKAAAA